MKKIFKIFIAICLVISASAFLVNCYHSTHKVWIPANEMDSIPDVIFRSEKLVYDASTITLSFYLENNSANTLCFGATKYIELGETASYQDKESDIYLQKQIDGTWCYWGIPEKYQNTRNTSTAGIEAEVPAGTICGFTMHSLQYLDKLDSGSYRAALPIYLRNEPGDIQNYEIYAEFSVQ